ncbi:flagellar hook-length control protein FliK [Paucidesulfovibrio longus]|uniref:flagellar hook-length control protein FliK n=1 Tax=Paucidesulfovibrio longus TaxID=889 RepID=UPI0003B6FBCD|nr:flagellar hook-length control protein FliK [Paucidesulfovibrio longus]
MQDVPLIQQAASSTYATNRTALFGGASTSSDFGSDIFQTFMDHQSALTGSGGSFAGSPNLDTVFRDAPKAEAPRRTETKPERTETKEPELNDMKDVPVSSESFQAMKPQLEKYGLSKEEIKEIEDRVESKEGLTWGQFVSTLSEKMSDLRRSVELDAGQRQKMMTMLQKLGFSATESKGMVAELSHGNVDNVLQAIGRQLESLPKDKLASLDKDELKAFMAELQKLKGNQDGKELSLVREVGKAMQEALDQARQKAMQLAQDKSADGKADTLADAARNAARQDASKAAGLNQNMTSDEAARKAARSESELNRNLDLEARLKTGAEKLADSVSQGSRFNEGKGADQFTKQNGNGESGAWNDFMTKLRVDRSELGGSLRTDNQSIQNAMSDALGQARGESSQTAKGQSATAPKMLNQVQDAVLKGLSNGAKRLTIQLNPQELGTLSVALTVKNKDVQATIRTDNAETAKLLSGHLDALRQSLEAQGLKVTKMEVQTQLPGQDGQQWLGEQGHNQAQDEQVRQQVRQRMNALRGNSQGIGLDLASDVRQAILSGNGLHIVA